MKPIQSALRRLAEATKVVHLTPWFALFGAIAAPANLLLGNHITFGFWVATMALPGFVLDLSRMLNGGKLGSLNSSSSGLESLAAIWHLSPSSADSSQLTQAALTMAPCQKLR